MSRRFQWRSEHSAEPFGHRSLALLSVCVSVFLSHCLSSHTPSHLPPACQTLHNRASIFHYIAPFLLLHALSTFSSPFPPPSASTPVMPGPQPLCQCVWLKCSPERNKICEENFIVSASRSLCSDSFCWWRGDLRFLFFFSLFPLLVVSGSSHRVSLWVFLDQDMAVLAAELYKISAWFLVN